MKLRGLTTNAVKKANDERHPPEHRPTRFGATEMDIFGYRPLSDSLLVVICLNCKKPIKASRFSQHIGPVLLTPRTLLGEIHTRHGQKTKNGGPHSFR